MERSLRNSTSALLAKRRSGLTNVSALLADGRKRWWFIAPLTGVLALAAGGLYYYRAYYLPSRILQQATLETTVVRRGNMILSARGTGILQPGGVVSTAAVETK